MRTRLQVLVALVLSFSAVTRAADIRVVSSGGFAAAYRTLAPEFEQTTGNHLITGWGPSMGNTTDAVPQRLARNEPIDVVIMVGSALGKLVQEGKITLPYGNGRHAPISGEDQARLIAAVLTNYASARPSSANPCKHLQRAEQRLRIVLALINRRRRGAALEQEVNCFPRRAGGALDGEGYFPGTSTWPMSPRLVAPSGTGGGMSPRLQVSQTLLT